MLDTDLLTKAVGDLDEDSVIKQLQEFAATNPSPEEAQSRSRCQSGMGIVGELFEQGEYFVGDLIFAGELLTNAVEILKPYLGGATSEKSAQLYWVPWWRPARHREKYFKSMAEAAGFEVHDLGIDQPPGNFVEKVKEVKPEIVGMSGVLTLALESMKLTVDALRDAGLRDSIKVIIGGNPVTKEACEQIGADAFTTNAAEGVKICQGWVK